MTPIQTLKQSAPLTLNPSGQGSHTPLSIAVEWTPSNEYSSVRIRSSWPTAIGKPLTGRRINQLIRSGYYGPTKQAKQQKKDAFRLAKQGQVLTTTNIIFRCCECGSKNEVRYLKFSYLPKPGDYCQACVAKHRKVKDGLEQLARLVRKAEVERLVDNYA